MKFYQVSIVIPAYNAQKTIGPAIESLLAQDYQSKPEIIIVDDGSTDATPEICKKYPITYMRQDNAGPASARNRGWRASKGELIFFMDSDCVAPPDWVSILVRNHEEEKVGCAGSIYGIANRESFLARIIYYEFLRRYDFCGKFTSFIGSYGYSFSRQVLEEVNGYNEEYRIASHEDNDLGWRIILKGYKLLLNKNCPMYHNFPTTLSRYLMVQMKHGYWRMKLSRDFPRSMKGDEYSNILDYAQPPLYLLAAFCILSSFFWPPLGLLGLLCILLALCAQLPVLKGLRRKGASVAEILFYSLVLSPLRATVRSFGMMAGLYVFWLLSRKR